MFEERPILMNGTMVRATLAGTKSQTRRMVKHGMASGRSEAFQKTQAFQDDLMPGCPHGKPGDRLWVRETWRGVVGINPPGAMPEYGVARYIPDQEHCRRVEYAATQECDSEPWRPSIHMPRWASRIVLEITDLRIERLQDISDADIEAEGINMEALAEAQERYEVVAKDGNASGRPTLRGAWRDLWESTGGDWDANPWLWAISFRRVTP
jgi:hypothetical protein